MAGPSIKQYLDASEVVYGESSHGGEETILGVVGGSPSETKLMTDESSFLQEDHMKGWKPITVDYVPVDGFYAAAFETPAQQIIIAFEGTVFGLSKFEKGTIRADNAIYDQRIPAALTDAVFFAKSVLLDATKLGVSDSQVFDTGHSLGGIEAEYASLELNVGGASFGATGIPGNTPSAAQPDFKNYVDYGDPIGNFASNMPSGTGEPSFAPSSDMAHVGKVVMVGSPGDAVTLGQAADDRWTFLFGAKFLGYHLLAHYASDFDDTTVPVLGAASSTRAEYSPENVLDTLESVLGAQGLADLSAASLISAKIVQTPDFTISTNAASDQITIVQKTDLTIGTQQLVSDAGTDVITLDPTSFNAIYETFTNSDNSTITQFLPDVTSAGDQDNVSFAASSNDTLLVDNPTSFAGTVDNFATNDAIDLLGLNASGAQIDGQGHLIIQEAAGGTLTYGSNATTAQKVFAYADGNGGTLLQLTEPAPETTVPGAQTATVGQPLSISGVSVTTPTTAANNELITVDLSDSSGLLAAHPASGGTVTGSGTTKLIISGNLAAVNSELATLNYTGTAFPGTAASNDVINVTTTDDIGQGDSHNVPVNVNNSVMTFDYVGNMFNPDLSDPPEFPFKAGNLTASATFDNLPPNFSGYAAPQNSWYISVYGMTINSSEPGEPTIGFQFVDGDITGWDFYVDEQGIVPGAPMSSLEIESGDLQPILGGGWYHTNPRDAAYFSPNGGVTDIGETTTLGSWSQQSSAATAMTPSHTSHSP
jgi:hypothetical protein